MFLYRYLFIKIHDWLFKFGKCLECSFKYKAIMGRLDPQSRPINANPL